MSIFVAAWSGLFVVGALLNQTTYGYQTETTLVGYAFAIFLLLGLWSARGSGVGTLLLAAALLAGALLYDRWYARRQTTWRLGRCKDGMTVPYGDLMPKQGG